MTKEQNGDIMGATKFENYSYEDYLNIDKTTKDNERYELIFGNIYMMAGANARHQDIVGNTYFKLRELSGKNCKARVAPFDLVVKCNGTTNVTQPDVMLFCKDKELPCAVFEVLSKSTAHKDMGVKKDLYLCAGINEYYIIDPELEIVSKYILDDGRYYFVKGFSGDDSFSVECLAQEIKVKYIFE